MTTNTDPVRALIELRTGVEMDAAHDPMGAVKLEALDAAIAALASASTGSPSDDLSPLLDNLMRAAYDDGDRGLEKFSGATMAAREAVLVHVRDAAAPQQPAVPSDENGGHRLVEPDQETALALADAPRSLRNYVAALRSAIAAAPQQPAAVDEAAAQRLADAAKGDLGWSHLNPQARVEKARRYLALAAQQQGGA